MTKEAEIQPFEHPSISREDFKKILLSSDVFEAITERIVSQGYSNITLAPIANDSEAELVETIIGIRGQDQSTLQFFPIRILLEKSNVADSKKSD